MLIGLFVRKILDGDKIKKSQASRYIFLHQKSIRPHVAGTLIEARKKHPLAFCECTSIEAPILCAKIEGISIGARHQLASIGHFDWCQTPIGEERHYQLRQFTP
ncbi:MAG: hypothetical protein Ta2B_30690 [Termitinemataceae bacterium]|nr:MAG: hypothetical protein Ta2B_30690 [Termitinemataceae bacterium]